MNYLLCDTNRKGLAKTEGENTSVLYGLEEDHFLLQMPHDFSYWVKLADFGTANSAIENIGQPISIDQVWLFRYCRIRGEMHVRTVHYT